MVPNTRIFVGLVSSCEISSPPVKLVETVGESGSKGMAIGGAVVAAEAEEARKIEMAATKLVSDKARKGPASGIAR